MGGDPCLTPAPVTTKNKFISNLEITTFRHFQSAREKF